MHMLVVLLILTTFEYQNTWCVSGRYFWGIGKSDSILFLASSYGVDLINVANPENPQYISSARTTGLGYDVEAAGDYLYICDDYAGLKIFDISDLHNPVPVGSLDTPGLATKVMVKDTFAYVADDWEGLRIINVADPAQPFETGFVNTPGRAVWTDIEGIYAYLADDEQGLQIINIEDPYNPYIIGQWYNSNVLYVWSVDVIDTLAFIGGEYADPGPRNFFAVNVSDPANPFYIAGVGTPHPAMGISIEDTIAYVCAQWSGVRIINMADPTNLYEIGHVDGQVGSDVVACNNTLYSALYADLNIHDVSDPQTPLLLKHYTNPVPYTVYAYCDGNYLFTLSVRDSVIISAFDCSVPESLVLLDVYSLSVPISLYTLGELYYESPYLYCGYPDLCASLAFDGLHLSEVFSMPIPGMCIRKKNNYLFVGNGDYYNIGLRVFDVIDPYSPQLVDSLSTISCHAFEFRDTLAFVSGGLYFYVLNIANPAHVAVVCSLNTQHYNQDLALSSSYAYTINEDYCIQTIDISDPLAPQIVNIIPTLDRNYDVYKYDSLLSVAGARRGLRLYSIENPAAPALVDSFDTPSSARGIARKDNYYYIADRTSLELVKYIDADISEGWSTNNSYLQEVQYMSPAQGTITFTLPYKEMCAEIYDVSGRALWKSTVKNSIFIWHGDDQHGRKLPAGIYFARFISPGHAIIKKIVLLK
jgi:hypothetical protein